MLLLDRTLSQIGNEIETMVQAITRGPGSRGVVCYYCHNPGHVIRDCKKRQNRNQKFQSAHIASTTEASDQSV